MLDHVGRIQCSNSRNKIEEIKVDASNLKQVVRWNIFGVFFVNLFFSSSDSESSLSSERYASESMLAIIFYVLAIKEHCISISHPPRRQTKKKLVKIVY